MPPIPPAEDDARDATDEPWSDADILLSLSETATSGLAAGVHAPLRVVGRAPGQFRHFFQEGSEEFVLGLQ